MNTAHEAAAKAHALGCRRPAAFVAYVVLFKNIEKETAFWIGALLFGIGLGYEIRVIKEKLDTLQGTLDDLRAGRD